MDGHFVPNLSMGPDVVKMARKAVDIPLSVHLMLSNPCQYITTFVEAGADSLMIHIEAECDVPVALDRIGDYGIRPGITLNPETQAEMVFPVLDRVAEVLCMSVHPGYGGQAFIPEVLDKIRAIRNRANEIGKKDLDILVDGGIDISTAERCARAGANAFIAGTPLYKAADMATDLETMRKAASEALTL